VQKPGDESGESKRSTRLLREAVRLMAAATSSSARFPIL